MSSKITEQDAKNPRSTPKHEVSLPRGRHHAEGEQPFDGFHEAVFEATPLSAAEKHRFEVHYKTIVKAAQFMASFEIAMEDIRINKLYRETHCSFECFCDEVDELMTDH